MIEAKNEPELKLGWAGGDLLNTRFGEEIDDYDAVIRKNGAPMERSPWHRSCRLLHLHGLLLHAPKATCFHVLNSFFAFKNCF